MKLVTSILLGSASALVAVAGAQAADLPVRKAAPVEYVKVCDAYGAGFFYIPGTDTCLKVGGRVRADYAMSSRSTVYNGAAIDGTTGERINNVFISGDSANLYGWEARGRVDLDARTQTPYGTVQAVTALRLSRSTGLLQNQNPGLQSGSASATLEAAYIRFAGFTFGAARDNFSFMPSTFYGAGHWSSFANGAKQIAYTAVFGGGMSATVAIQDLTDTSNDSLNIAGYTDPVTGLFVAGIAPPGLFAYNTMPQVNGRIDWSQGWGSASLMGAVGRVNQTNRTGVLGLGDASAEKTVWAVGAGVKVNLPMIAAGDVLWLNGAYADGMTEYTVNWLYFKSSDTKRNTGGFVQDAPSWVNYVDGNGNAQIQTLKSWNLAAVFTHYWAPQWRHSFIATGGRIQGTGVSNAAAFNAGGFGSATVWNVGTQLTWLPSRNFEIGVDILYNRVSQDVRRELVAGTSGAFCNVATGCATRETEGAWTGRLRVERTF